MGLWSLKNLVLDDLQVIQAMLATVFSWNMYKLYTEQTQMPSMFQMVFKNVFKEFCKQFAK